MTYVADYMSGDEGGKNGRGMELHRHAHVLRPPNDSQQHKSLGGKTLKFRRGMGVPERSEWTKMRAQL